MPKQMSKETLKILQKTGFFRLQEKHGTKRQRQKQAPKPTISKLETVVAPLSNKIESNGLKRDIMAHRWKRGLKETPETVREMERKAQASAPLYNKGGYMLITPGTSPKDIGRK